MVYNERLAEKIRALLKKHKATEKKMFGGLAFMLDGKMSMGITGDDLMIRVGKEQHEKALALPAARPMDFTGKPMKGYAYIGPAGWQKDATLKKCVDMSVGYVRALPKKAGEK
jgi:hypothetical protein